jgi:hypothetical protein
MVSWPLRYFVTRSEINWLGLMGCAADLCASASQLMRMEAIGAATVHVNDARITSRLPREAMHAGGCKALDRWLYLR